MDIKLPNLGEGADSGVVVSILVKEGEEISAGQNLIELETGKAVASIPASAGGKVEQIRVKVGDKITPGAVIVTVTGGGAAAAPAAAPAKAAPAPQRPAAPAPKPAAAPAPDPEPEEELVPTLESTDDTFTPPASPTIRKLARDLGIDLRRIKGSQHGGRIVLEDLRGYVQGLIRQAEKAKAQPASTTASAPARTAAVTAPVSIDFSQWGAITRKAMSPLRQVIAKRMLESTSTLPQVTQFDDADVTVLNTLRKKYAAAYEAKGARLTLTGFAIIAVVQTLKKHPLFNASIDDATQEIVMKAYHHIGIAVDTEAGLVVPVLRNADQKSLLELSLELGQIAEKARDRKLTTADMQGGSFTISNQGAIGGGYFTPIINKPEVAVLGIGKGAVKPVITADGKIEGRPLMPLGLSYDHRLIDGGSAARFIVDLRQALETFPEELVKLGA
ncbi:MAG: 2-oxo acid dehydrogenase subunit E2 [Verrucomicrobiota bacterium]